MNGLGGLGRGLSCRSEQVRSSGSVGQTRGQARAARDRVAGWRWFWCVGVVLLAGFVGGSRADVIMNGLRVSAAGKAWYWAGPTEMVDFAKVTNTESREKADVRLYFTGQQASPWPVCHYVGNGTWEAKSWFTGATLAITMQDLPTAQIPSGQQVNLPSGEARDAQYPYYEIGTLASGQTVEVRYSVRYAIQGQSSKYGDYWAPYRHWLSPAFGGQGPNHPPVARDSTVFTRVNTPVQFILNASDPDGDALTWDLMPASGPLNGQVHAVRGESPLAAMYLPRQGFSGTDSFRFIVSDRKSTSNVATVTIIVQRWNGGRAFFDDFEDGDYTSNPPWVISNPGYTSAGVQPDPARPGNMALAIHGTDQAHGMLDASVGVAYNGFDASMEYLATVASAAHPTLQVTNGGVNIAIYYFSEGPTLSVCENVEGTEHWHQVAAGTLSANTWYKIRMWHAMGDGRVHAEIRSVAGGALIGEVSFAPLSNLLTQPSITTLRIGAEETAWQYIDNVALRSLPGI